MDKCDDVAGPAGAHQGARAQGAGGEAGREGVFGPLVLTMYHCS
jgi:hypothetical protein